MSVQIEWKAKADESINVPLASIAVGTTFLGTPFNALGSPLPYGLWLRVINYIVRLDKPHHPAVLEAGDGDGSFVRGYNPVEVKITVTGFLPR